MNNQKLATAIGLIGLLAFAATAIASVGEHALDSAVPTIALLFLMVALVVRFPTLIQDGTTALDGNPNVSTMRICILMVVLVFSLLTFKAGWEARSLADLHIDPSWAWVLAAAFGGKAFQSFSEGGRDAPAAQVFPTASTLVVAPSPPVVAPSAVDPKV